MKIYIIWCVHAEMRKSYIWEKIFSRDISQSGSRIFKSTVSPEQVDETA